MGHEMFGESANMKSKHMNKLLKPVSVCSLRPIHCGMPSEEVQSTHEIGYICMEFGLRLSS